MIGKKDFRANLLFFLYCFKLTAWSLLISRKFAFSRMASFYCYHVPNFFFSRWTPGWPLLHALYLLLGRNRGVIWEVKLINQADLYYQGTGLWVSTHTQELHAPAQGWPNLKHTIHCTPWLLPIVRNNINGATLKSNLPSPHELPYTSYSSNLWEY